MIGMTSRENAWLSNSVSDEEVSRKSNRKQIESAYQRYDGGPVGHSDTNRFGATIRLPRTGISG